MRPSVVPGGPARRKEFPGAAGTLSALKPPGRWRTLGRCGKRAEWPTVSAGRSALTQPSPSERPETGAADRRTLTRHPCILDLLCSPAGGRAGLERTGSALNLSQTGVCLEMNQPFELGTNLQLRIANPLTDAFCIALGQVVNVSQLPDGTWAMGCRFAHELSADQVKALVSRPGE